jgi:hypothetical protein
MLKIVRFKSLESLELAEEMTKKIQSYFYDVTRDRNELKFYKFDEQAFNCVIALENLSWRDYSFVDNKESWIAPVYHHREPRIILELAICNTTRTSCHHFRLLVCNTFQISRTMMDEIPLVINPELLFFATLIKRIAENILEPIPIIDSVTSAICIRDSSFEEPTLHRILKIERNGETKLYRFFPTDLTIHWGREQF